MDGKTTFPGCVTLGHTLTVASLTVPALYAPIFPTFDIHEPYEWTDGEDGWVDGGEEEEETTRVNGI